ncbi:MAG TPA: ATP-binding protein, partial [Candidatus Dormibacteraeota bacterium]|nr:ATP-binding protein [Candidatus Dormibacteraeota bacterium]
MESLIERMVEARLDQLMRAFRVVVVNGPRQAGKTTLLQMYAERHGGELISLDERARLEIAQNDPRTLIEEAERPTMIDEVQRAGDPLVLAIKYVVDRDRSRGQFLLSGSAQFLTVPRLSESLAGRAAFLDMWPLAMVERVGTEPTFADFMFTDPSALRRGRTRWTRNAYLDLITGGGYPEVLSLAPSDRRTWFDSYLRTVVSRDIVEFAQIERGAAVPRLLALLAARSGSATVVADLAGDLEMNQQTIRNYLSYLNGVFLTVTVPPWSANLTAKAAKAPKTYLADTGLAAHVLMADASALRRPDHPAIGGLVESFVFTELTKLRSASSEPFKVHYYRDRGGREVDFVLERHDGLVAAIEVKATASPSSNHAANLVWLRDRVGDRFTAGIVLHLGDA